MTVATQLGFHSECKKWRQFRKLSQLDLALEADISQRHISYLETGRSQPSREMVLRLANAMDVPLRERNSLLQAAGFAGEFQESQLDEPQMAPVLDAVNRVLEYHDPLPAILVDRFWEVKKANRAAQHLFDMAASVTGMTHQGPLNIALMTLHPNGMRNFISNWQQVLPLFIRRLRSEAAASGDPEVQERLHEFLRLAGPIGESQVNSADLLPVMPVKLQLGEVNLSLFSVISTFGTPQDITTDELRMEAFYPTDQQTEAYFKQQISLV